MIYVENFTLHYARKWSSEDSLGTILKFGTDEVMSDEFDKASGKLGGFVLGVLQSWHPDVFNNWGSRPEGDEAEAQIINDFDIAMHLISKSVSDKTRVHIHSIETLLREQSSRTRAGNEFYSESRPTIRTRLEKFV